ncbi:DUF411 domain-containing protein [Pseudomonadota bacterium]
MTKTRLAATSLIAALFIGFATGSNAGNSSDSTPVNSAKPIEITVYKSPSCGCCKGWVDHLRTEGFNVITHDHQNMDPIKKSAGIPGNLQSCHTALVEGYAIEGHVPAADIKKLLKNRPNIAGLTAPGMPMKSPGMQAAHLAPKDYDVLAFGKNGKTAVFTKY